jgi:hypothetical protein
MTNIKNFATATAIFLVFLFIAFQVGRYEERKEIAADSAKGDSTVHTTTITQTSLIPQKPKFYSSVKPKIIKDTSYQHIVDSLKRENLNKDSLIAYYSQPREFQWGDSTTGIADIKIFPAEQYRTEPMIIPAPTKVETKTVDREVEKLIYVYPTFWDKLQYYAEGGVVGGVAVGVYVIVHGGKL